MGSRSQEILALRQSPTPHHTGTETALHARFNKLSEKILICLRLNIISLLNRGQVFRPVEETSSELNRQDSWNVWYHSRSPYGRAS